MRQRISLLLCLVILYTVMATSPAHAQTSNALDPTIAAKACALIEASSGRILYQNNGDAQLPMASTTKIMTALVVLENAKLSDVVTIGRNASGVEGSSIYLEVGEKLTVEQLLLGLLLRSGNDAAVALAEHVSGSVESFVALMNATAMQMGLSATHFKNPHGLPAQDHYTSALDLASIMAQAIQHPDFIRIATTQKIQIPWEGHAWNRVLQNKNKFLADQPGTLGGKTGFTKEAGRCLVEAVERNGMQLISVVLNCPDWWNQSANLIDYGFDHYQSHTFIEENEWVHTITTGGLPGTIDIVASQSMSLPVMPTQVLSLRIEIPSIPPLPIAAGTPLGIAIAMVDGKEVTSINLIAKEAVAKNALTDVIAKIFGYWVSVPTP